MERNLPIQLVETRGKQDIFLKEGFGNDELPEWATNESIERNVGIMRSTLAVVQDIFDQRDARHEDGLPVLIVATLHDKATAKSFRPNARALFDSKKKRNIIGVGDPKKLIIKIDSKKDLTQMASNIDEGDAHENSKVKRCGIAAINDLQLFAPFIEDDIVEGTVKIRLIDYLDSRLNETSEALFLTRCKASGIDIKTTSFSKESRLYYADKITSENVSALAVMDSVISVKKMPYFQIVASPEPYNTTIKVKEIVDGEEYPIVGILDSGIEPIPHLEKWTITEDNTADFAEEYIDKRHGTAVAGIINYGDDFLGESVTKCSPSKLISCIVNIDSDEHCIGELEMVEHIKSAIEAHPKVKVWNLSQGSSNEIEDNCFSDFAIEIDKLQKKHNVLICKSAGNIDPRTPNKTRISQGADSVRSLVVGSIANSYLGEGDAQPYQRSPFSKIGPGPSLMTKPDLVHIGGNRLSGVHSFSEVGFEGRDWRGTSFSTPRIAAMAANIAHRLNRDFNPTLIKALLIHNSFYPNTEGMDSQSLLKELGHGMPTDIETILNNDPNEFTMVWHPSLSEGDLQIQDIPFPTSMIDDDGLFYGDITVTLVTDPVLKSTEGAEYCQSDIDVLLQTYDGIDYYMLNAVGTPKTYRNDERLRNPQNVLAKSLYGAGSFKSAKREERTLIEAAQKFQPVKKYHINLEKMTKANRIKHLKGDKKWCLRINSLYRDATMKDRDYDGVIETAKATVIITIRDTRNQGKTYDECYASLDQHNFVHSNIMLRQHVEVNN